MGAKLTITPAAADPFEVTVGNTTTIGRTRENAVCLVFSPQVSRQHAIIRCHNGYQYQLIDLGSRNGTYVNDRRVVMPVALEHGAQIRIADNLMVFHETADESSGETMRMTVAGKIADVLPARSAALLVCDIRGFSTMSERIDADNLAQVLGQWFRETGNFVSRSGGTIDKFIGDAMLAYWGSLETDADNCRVALETARILLGSAASRTWPDGTPFKVAVALHHGVVSLSNVGVAADRDATIIGDAVNTVFRLEALAKELRQELICSGDFQAHIKESGDFLEFGPRSLKGKSQTVNVYGFNEPS